MGLGSRGSGPGVLVCSVSKLCMTLCFQGPYEWVLKGSRAVTIRSLEASGERMLP